MQVGEMGPINMEPCPSNQIRMMLFLLLLLMSPTVFGVFRMQDYTSLIPNAKKGMLYLFMYPRTSTSPSQAPLNMKVEMWLKWANIPFYRINNQFLGFPKHGTAPFAYYINERDEAKWIEGSDAIIDFVDELKNGKKEKTEEEIQMKIQEKKLRKEIDNKFFKILMLDRDARDKTGKGGLDWMFADEGVAAQMVPYLGIEKIVEIEIGKSHYHIQMNRESWLAYFDVYNLSISGRYFPEGKCAFNDGHMAPVLKPCVEAKMKFLKKYLMEKESKKMSCLPFHCSFKMADWVRTSDAIHGVVHEILKSVLKAGPLKEDGQVTNPNSSEAKLDQLLKLNLIEEGGEPFYLLYENHQGTFDLLMDQLKPILVKLLKSSYFLFGIRPTPADASLFAFLVQFFETPLNIPQLREYFQPENGQIDADVQQLWNYMERLKSGLKISEIKWTELTQKPWPLNYELPAMQTSKFEGPFQVETEDLYDLFPEHNNSSSTCFAPLCTKSGIIKQAALEKAPKVVQAAVEKIHTYALKEQIGKKVEAQMLRVMASYTCNLGAGKTEQQGGKCAEKHMQMVNMPVLITDSKELIYEAIVEYNNGLVLEKILAALAKAKEAAARKDPNAVSDPKFGNEF